MKRIAKISFKALVSGIFIVFLLLNIDLDQLIISWKDINWIFLVFLATVIFVACTVINVMRWDLILRQQGTNIPFWYLIIIYTKGAFVGSFFPGGTTTGDIYRMYSLTKNTQKKAVSVSSVIIERIMGVFALLSLSLCTIYYSIFFEINNDLFMHLLKPVLFLTILFSMVGALSIALIKMNFTNRFKSTNLIISKLQYFVSIISNYFSNRTTLGKIFVLSLLFQVIIVFWIYMVSQVLHIRAPLYALCVTVPLINLFALLPISIGGLGVREAAFVFFLAPFGLVSYEAVSISFISGSLQNVLRLLFGFLFFLNVKPWKISLKKRIAKS